MSLFSMLEMSGSAMAAERQRADVVAANMANADTTRTPEGGPYRRKQVVFSTTQAPFRTYLAALHKGAEMPAGMVRVSAVVQDPTPPLVRYEPGHPDADAQGYVAYPAIDPTFEMVDLMGAVRAYQLNATAVNAAKQMIQQSLDIIK